MRTKAQLSYHSLAGKGGTAPGVQGLLKVQSVLGLVAIPVQEQRPRPSSRCGVFLFDAPPVGHGDDEGETLYMMMA